jgi:hypothetical protein
LRVLELLENQRAPNIKTVGCRSGAATVAAFDEGICEAEADRTVPIDEAPAQVDYGLLFTQRPLNDLSEIVGHIAQDDDEAASRFGGRPSQKGRGFVSWSTARFSFTTKSMRRSV